MRKRSFLIAMVTSVALAAGPAEEKQTTLKTGDAAPEPNFEVLSDGSRPRLADFEGKYLFLDFWATWCPPCVESIPHLNALQARFRGRPARFFSITYEPAGMVRPFLEKHGLEVPVGLDDDFSTFQAYRAWGIPTLYVINPEGTIVSVASPFDVTEEVVEAVLAGGVPDIEQYEGWPDPQGAEEYFRSLVEKWKAAQPGE